MADTKDHKDTALVSKPVEVKTVVASTEAQTKTEQALASRASAEADNRKDAATDDDSIAAKAASGDEAAQEVVYSTLLNKEPDDDAKVPKEDKEPLVRQARTEGTPKTGVTG